MIDICFRWQIIFQNVFNIPNQDEKYKKMSEDLKKRIKSNYILNDTDYVYIDCFGRSNKHRKHIMVLKSRNERESVQVYKVYKRMCAGTLLTRRLSASPTSQKTKAFFIFRFLSQKTKANHWIVFVAVIAIVIVIILTENQSKALFIVKTT